MLGLGRMKLNLYFIFTLFQLSLTSFVNAQSINISQMQLISPAPNNCSTVDINNSKWKKVSLRMLPKHQHFCLATQIQLEENSFSSASLYLSLLASSKIYWDGNLIHENGVVAKSRSLEQAGFVDVVVQIPSNLLHAGTHTIAIEASNFHLHTDAIPTSYGFRIIETSQAHGYIVLNSILSAFILGCLFIFSTLFQLLFWLYQRQNIYQIFSLLCFFSTCLLLTEKWRVMFGLSYDLQNLRLQMVMLFTFLNSLLLPIFYLIYTQSSFKTRWIFLTFNVLLASLLLNPEYDDKGISMYFSSLLIALCINLLALKNSNKGHWANTIIILIGIIVFAVEPTKFTEDRFTLALFAINAVMLVSIIQEMKNNRVHSLASVRLEAELLKRNLQPHFLMNSLMLAIEWIEEKPNAAAEFVQALSEELRMLVRFSSLSVVSLEEEIALCRCHIAIMSYRYDTNYTFNVSGLQHSIFIPPAIIHTQIENAFSHNEIPDDANFTLTITREKNQITLTLISPHTTELNQRLYSKDEAIQPGIGERYIKSRLAEYFHNNFTYQSFAQGTTWINIIQFKAEA